MTYKNLNISHPQSGAALIVVLLVLVLVTLIGAIAVQRSSSDLKLATASQVDKLTFQSTDAAFNKLEKEDRNLGNANSVDNIRGYITRPGKQYVNREVVFCLRPKTQKFFDQTKLTEKTPDGVGYVSGKNNGFCDVSESSDYVGEDRAMTQMTFVKNEVADALPYGQEGKETYTDDQVSKTGQTPFECANFEVYATSLLPSFSEATANQINQCLKKINSDGLKDKCEAEVKAAIDADPDSTRTMADCSIDACLESLSVPFNTQMQAYTSKPIGVKCLN